MGLYRLFTASPSNPVRAAGVASVCVCVCVCVRARACAPRHSLPGGGTHKPAEVPDTCVTGKSSGVLLCIVLWGSWSTVDD